MFPIEPRVFGCTCSVRVVHPQVSKLETKSLKCVFLAYVRLQQGYRCFPPLLNKYLLSADVIFHEHMPFFSTSTASLRLQEDDDLLVYHVTYQTLSNVFVSPPPPPQPKPPILKFILDDLILL